jgi:hypothetical protein
MKQVSWRHYEDVSSLYYDFGEWRFMEEDDSLFTYWIDWQDWTVGFSWQTCKGDLIGVYLHFLCFNAGVTP